MPCKISLIKIYEWNGLYTEMVLTKYNFEILEIWKSTINICEQICEIAERLEKLHLTKYSDYIKDVCMRISNTFTEFSDQAAEKNSDPALTETHLLLLEAENIIMILYEQQLIELSDQELLMAKIQFLDEKIIEFKQQFVGKPTQNKN